MEGVIRRYGIPLAIYGDRHGVFKFNGKPRHITQPVGPTQFTRAMGEWRLYTPLDAPLHPVRHPGKEARYPRWVTACKAPQDSPQQRRGKRNRFNLFRQDRNFHPRLNAAIMSCKSLPS